jgi:acyl transferase domain-containing protein/acyl-CoA synthetase (AMP-forming)/AMP-acid ligase II/acyl carrier protein/GNAT superfamily N-acetyltransferase
MFLQPEFKLQILDGFNIENYRALTYKANHKYLTPDQLETSTIAIGAAIFDIPVGLLLATLLPDRQLVRIVSLFVGSHQRRQGIGRALLAKLEQVAGAKGYTQAEVSYLENLPTGDTLARLLVKAGWSKPVISGMAFEMTPGLGASEGEGYKADFSNLTLPEGCVLFKWADLSPDDQTRLLATLKTDPRYKGLKTPRFSDFEPLNSLGLLYKGEIAGWQLTSRIRPDTIAYDGLFVRADVRSLAGGNSLMLHAVALQQRSGIPVWHWQIEIFQKQMLKLVESIVTPYPHSIVKMLVSQKSFEFDPATDPDRARLPEFNSLAELLRWRAFQQPFQTAFTFLPDGEKAEISLTYGELDSRASRVAATLREHNLSGQNVLLTLPSGLDWITGFFGCLYAGAVPVLAFTPDLTQLAQTVNRLESVVGDAGIAFGLTGEAMRDSLVLHGQQSPILARLRWLSVEQTAAPTAPESKAAANLPASRGADLAFLLYTSGSTGQPKGVMISHANALSNIRHFPGYAARPLGGIVSWLSPTHTMGLFFGILHPLYHGVPAVLLPSWAVMQQPVRWLQAVSRYRATATVGSNFAFDLCSRRIGPAERAALDLSCWNIALSGGEPVSSQTLRKFSETFAACGFRPETFYPSYGMSEATNAISGAAELETPVYLDLASAALTAHKVVAAAEDSPADAVAVKTVTGCGGSLPGQQIRIVNPATRQEVLPGEIGEIWVSGPSVALGYWNQPEATAATFHNFIAGSGAGPCLRTGDLGFLQEGRLFITGRLKELIVVHGRKHYPQDIEATIEKSHPAIAARGVAAFALEVGGEEKLGLAVEVEAPAGFDSQAIFSAIRHRVATGHDLETYTIALVAPGSLPRTASQKLQRQKCRDLMQSGELETLASWQVNTDSSGPAQTAISGKAPDTGDSLLAFLITQRLTAYFAGRLGIEPAQVDVNQSFAFYGLVSLEAVNLISELQTWLNRPLSPTLTWEYPNIAALANFIAGFAGQPEPLPAPSDRARPDLEPVALVGIGCRFPGARSKAEFWNLLCEGRDSVTEVPADRWDAAGFYDPDSTVPGKMTTRWGGFVADLDQFEPLFFGISPREAVHLDPRQRLILEAAWEALEDAGIASDKLAGSQTGVFISTLGSDYGNLMFDDVSRIEAFSGAGAADSILANRLSYFLDLKGPSLSLDTACSGSLVAIHLACQSLRTGESNLALVGGVNVILKPDANIFFSKAEALAADGRCKVFDASANGIVRSEGAGVVVLKPLSQALADNDRVYAIIRGSAVNSDGRSKGIMAPDKQAQQAVLRRAYEQAGVSPGQVQYVEAHGTGTRLGDPIEVQALGSVLSQGREAGEICALGSLKSNIGHTEAAAGIAGLIKVALALHHRQIPPNLHYHNPNPLIPFGELPLAVQTQLGPWPQPEKTLYAGVSSFGFGGTNAHVVLEESPLSGQSAAESPAPAYLLPLSAQNEPALKALAQAYRNFFENAPETLDLGAVCRTAGAGRNHFNYRHSVTGANRPELLAQLDAFLADQPAKAVSHTNRLVWVFSGQGSHWLGMGREMLAVSPVFRSTLERCEALLQPLTGWSLLEELHAPEEASRLNETDRTQPAIFAIQVGLAAVWASCGIVPDAVVGQSLGEVAAAHVSGALSLEEAILVVAERSRLMKTTSGRGKTALVELPIEQAELAIASCSDVLSVAGSNSPTSSVLSGDPVILGKVLAYLQKQNVFGKMLPGVDVAFHSPQMDPIRGELEARLAGLQPRPTTLPLYSTVTGQLIAGEELGAAYWGRNLRDPFLFSGVVKLLAGQGFNLWLEVSPHPVLGSSILQGVRANPDDTAALVLNSMRRNSPEWAALLNNLGALYGRGYNPDWAGITRSPAPVVSLPTYPWQRQRFWFDQIAGLGVRFDYPSRKAESVRHLGSGQKAAGQHPLLAGHVELAFQPGQHVWSGSLGLTEQPYLADHKVQGLTMLPGAAYLEMFLAAARQLSGQSQGQGQFALSEVEFKEALVLPPEGFTSIQLGLTPDPDRAEIGHFRLASLAQPGKWRRHSAGQLERLTAPAPAGLTGRELAEIQGRCGGLLSKPAHYERMEKSGLHYGPSFQAIEQIWFRGGESLAQLQLPNHLVFEAEDYHLHPVMLDGAFQAVSAAFPASPEGGPARFLPVGVRRYTFYGPASRTMWAYVTFPAGTDFQAGTVAANISLLNEEYRLVATVESLRLKRLRAAESKTAPEDCANWLYTLDWQTAPALTAAANSFGYAPASALIFADEGEIGSILGLNLEAQGETCLTVRPGPDYRFSLVEQSFELDPARPDHFRRLVDDLLTYDFPPCRQVIYLWGVDTRPERFAADPASFANFQAAQDRATLGFLHLVQALTRRSQELLPRLWLVTNGYAGLEEPAQAANLAQASLWGLGGVVLNEHPELRCSRVDLSLEPSAAEIITLLDLLGQENFGEQWAVRSGQLFVQRLVRAGVALPTPAQVAVPGLLTPVCQPDATYLVTGGLGGLGLPVAEWLVEQGARHLLLVGRSQPSAEAQAILHALKTQGIQVVIASADVTNPAEVAGVLARCGGELPPLKGLIHAAAVIKDGILSDLNKERFDDVIAPKLRGAWNLHRQTLANQLDFFVMFSSMTSVLGVSGQGNYVAANTFLDRLAVYRRQQGLPAVSINWGPWSEVGQASIKGRSDRMASKGIGSIRPDLGLLILGELIRRQLPQVAAIDVNWKLLSETSPLLNRTGFIQSLQENAADGEKAEGAADEAETAAILGDILAVEGKARRTLVENYLTEKVCRVLGLQGAAIDLHQSTFELGFDSLMTVELKVWVEKDLAIVIPAETLLQGPSIYQLAGEVVNRLPAPALNN